MYGLFIQTFGVHSEEMKDIKMGPVLETRNYRLMLFIFLLNSTRELFDEITDNKC